MIWIMKLDRTHTFYTGLFLQVEGKLAVCYEKVFDALGLGAWLSTILNHVYVGSTHLEVGSGSHMFCVVQNHAQLYPRHIENFLVHPPKNFIFCMFYEFWYSDYYLKNQLNPMPKKIALIIHRYWYEFELMFVASARNEALPKKIDLIIDSMNVRPCVSIHSLFEWMNKIELLTSAYTE